MATIILVGVAGFGANHLSNIRRVQSLGRAALIACVDPVVRANLLSGLVDREPSQPMVDGVPLLDTLAEAILAVGRPDIVVVSVPIHLHAAVTSEALSAGSDVLLEKPPFARMADFEAMLDLERETGRVVQIGFQSLGSSALQAFDSGELGIGKIRSVRAMGTWTRTKKYFERSAWVGRKSIGDIDVVDGVTTNSLAHAVATALRIAGVQRAEEVGRLEMEMYRANAVDVDDTTSLRVTPVDGPIVTAALTICAGEQTTPTVEVVGEKGTASFEYTLDDVVVTMTPDSVLHFDRLNLLENLIDHRKHGTPLLVPLWSTGALMRIVEAIRTSTEPIHIEKKYIEQRGTGPDSHRVVQDVEKWVRAAASADALFSEVGAPWAFTGRDKVLTSVDIAGRTVMEIVDGGGTTPSSSPRPYIHPVRTLGGVELTATRPADHDWHNGLGFCIADVNGSSFWGGGTFVRDRGYVVLDDHGRMTTEDIQHVSPGPNNQPAGLDHNIAWHDRDNRLIIRERRALRWAHLETSLSSGWELSFRSSLTAIVPLSIGSPGTNGRPNAGYGGFFWRFPPCSNISIHSAHAEGEDAVHGSTSPYIAWAARFEARPGCNGDATLVVVPEDETTAGDRWFVRCSSFPGIGSALAWDRRLEVAEGETVSRGFRIAVLDGRLDREGGGAVAEELRGRVEGGE